MQAGIMAHGFNPKPIEGSLQNWVPFLFARMR